MLLAIAESVVPIGFLLAALILLVGFSLGLAAHEILGLRIVIICLAALLLAVIALSVAVALIVGFGSILVLIGVDRQNQSDDEIGNQTRNNSCEYRYQDEYEPYGVNRNVPPLASSNR